MLTASKWKWRAVLQHEPREAFQSFTRIGLHDYMTDYVGDAMQINPAGLRESARYADGV